QGGNDVDNTDGISTSCQRRRCAVIGRPAGGRVNPGNPGKTIILCNYKLTGEIHHEAVTDSGE
ncbi:MAG: hypothetical protein P1P81_04560, partial [Desulfobulbales bacterium]|nr:hypothetical protein [Desulfobulbales bacterium]